MPDTVKHFGMSHLRLVIVGALASLVLGLWFLHSSFVRTHVLAWAVERVRTEAGIRAEVERLDYNLLTLRLSVWNATLTAAEAETPFFSVDALRVDLPWTFLSGRIAIQALEVDRPRLAVTRSAEGVLNLPDTASKDRAATQTSPIEIDEIVLRDLRWSYEDRPVDLSIEGRGVSLDMSSVDAAPLAGRLTMSAGATIHLAGRQTTISRVEGRFTFDGRVLGFEDLIVAAPEARVALDGRVDLLASVPRVDVHYEGLAALESVAPWIVSRPQIGGNLAFSGTVSGALDSPHMSVSASGESLTWAGQRGASLEFRAAMSRGAATVETMRLTLAGGEIAGDARIEFSEQAPSRARVQWKTLDLGTLARALAWAPPVRVGAMADGEATAEWTGRDLMTATGRVETRFRAERILAGALPLDGRLLMLIDRGRWHVTLHQLLVGNGVIEGDANGRLQADDLMATTLDGRFNVETEDLSDLLRRVRRAGLDLSADATSAVNGRVAVSGVLAGTLESPRVTGLIEADALEVARVGTGTFEARFSADRAHVVAQSWHFQIGPNSVTGTLAVDLEAQTLRGTLTAALPRLSLVGGALPHEWRPVGNARLEATFGGTLENPSAYAALSTGVIDLAGQRVGPLNATVRLTDHALALERFELAQVDGRLSVRGRYALDSGWYAVEAAGRNLVVRRVTPGVPSRQTDSPESGATEIPIEARFDLNVSGEGTLDAPQGRATLQFADLRWAAYDLGRAHIAVSIGDGRARFVAEVPALQTTLEAAAALESPRQFTAAASVSHADLARLLRTNGPAGIQTAAAALPETPPPLSGAITMHATAHGKLDQLADATVDLDVSLIDVTVSGAPIRLDREARLRYRAGAIVADDVALRIGETTLSAYGRFGTRSTTQEGLVLALKGSLADLAPLMRLAPGLDHIDAVAGSVDLVIRASGALGAPTVNGTVSVAGASFGTADIPRVDNVAARATFDKGLLTLGDARASWQGATITATGAVPVTLFGDWLPDGYRQTLPALRDRARLSVALDSVTPAVLAPFVDAETLGQIAGHFASTATIEATSLEFDRLRADMTFHRAELTMGGVPLRQMRPTQLRLANGRIEILDWIWSGGRNQINAHGHVQLDGDSPQLDVSLDGSLDLRMLGALSRDIAASGLATFDTRTRGPSSEPRIDGQIVLREGELALRDPRVAVTDLTGTIVLTASRLQFMDVRASINGGTLQMSGEVQYPGFRLARGSIDLSGRGLALEVPAGLRSEVDADLTFAVSEETPALTGRLTVLRGSYRRPISLVGQLLSQVDVASATPVEPPGLLDRIRLSISVVSSDGIVIDNNYGRLEIESGLKVTGTPAQPALAGRLTIGEGGAVFLAGQTWRVERGIVDFTSATRIEPTFDLALVTRVQRYDVMLSVTGTADTLEANLTSPDGLSQADAVSLLLTGRLADESTAAHMDIARGQLVLLLSGELIGFAGRAVGLDSAQVGQGLGGAASDFDLLAGDTDPSARLTVSKQLRRDVEVIVSQSLRDGSDLTWIAAYRPARAIEFRTTVGNNDARSYEFRHELNFGGGGRRVRPGPREPRVAPRVTTVRFAGAPGFGEGELRARLTLDAGDRFDFYRWQQDQDRLARLYHERGYLEARIQASRGTQNTPNGEPGVALAYAIERGPVTTLSVEGASLPDDVLEQMREAWARAVFDGFLLEDLEVMARRTLVEQGYVQAQAQADVIDSGDAAVKHVVVHVSPGVRFDDRRLVFRGQEYRSADQLEEVVRTHDLSVTAWLRPTEVEAALVQYYRALGYLSARVLVQAPVFTGRSATRVVHIDEGPRFQVVSVDIHGVQARSDAEIRRVFGIEAPAPYEPSLLESGRREVELVYLRDGYNNARVSVTSLIDTEQAQVHLSLTVDEGRQQVLEAVAVAGADITASRTIARALDLTLGQPAGLSDANRAQKRLYDTGVFQRAEIALEPIGGDVGTVTQPVRAVVTLEEAPAYRFRYGIRLGDQTGPIDVGRKIRPGLVVDLLRRNLFGRTVSAGLASQVETDRRLVRGILSTPRSFGLPVTSSLFLTKSRQDLPSGGQTPVVEDALDMTLEQGFRPRASMAVSYGYRFKRAHVFQPAAGGAVVPEFDVQVDVARLTGTWAWDTRDDPFDAHTGWFHSSGVEYAAAAMGSDLRFVKYVLQQYYFTPVAPDAVLASAFRLGTARGFAQDLIPSERFFVGGATSVRGFAEDGLGDTGVFGDPLGGNGSLIVNQEIRFPLYKWVRGVGFVDAGNVFSRVSELSLFDVQVGTGVGLRINTPFGLARIDFGMPLTSRRREPFGRWYVSLGQAF